MSLRLVHKKVSPQKSFSRITASKIGDYGIGRRGGMNPVDHPIDLQEAYLLVKNLSVVFLRGSVALLLCFGVQKIIPSENPITLFWKAA